MRVELLITDLTFMRDGRVCLAGVDRNLQTIRPMLPKHLYKAQLYLESGDVLHPRAVVSMFVEKDPESAVPHIEDYVWFPYGETIVLRKTSTENWHNVLRRTSSPSVADIFGVPIENRNHNIREGQGIRSLGTLQPATITELWYKGHDERNYQYRLGFSDASGELFDLPINDLTLLTYIERLQKNGLALDYIMDLLLDRFQRSETWLRIGLTRPFQGWCWLQVTGIYTFPDYLVGKCFAELE